MRDNWQIKVANTKTIQRIEPAASRIVRISIFLVAIALLLPIRIPLPWLYFKLWPVGYLPFWLGAGRHRRRPGRFAVWAREYLSRNWSSSVTIKQGHEH